MTIYSGAAFQMEIQKLDDGRDFICFFPLFPGIVRSDFEIMSPTTHKKKKFFLQYKDTLSKGMRPEFLEMMKRQLNLDLGDKNLWWKTEDEDDVVYRVFTREN